MRSRDRWLARAAVVALALAAGAVVAAAAPPANDDIAHAVAVPSVPFRFAESTIAATSAPDDPLDCPGENSVWFRFTPDVSGDLQADTFPSDYAAQIGIYTGTPGALAPLACAAFTFAGNTGGARFHADAGTTYSFLVNTVCCGAGHLVFRLAPPTPPLRLEITVRRGLVDPFGFVQVEGTVRCNHLGFYQLGGTVYEQVGPYLVGPRSGFGSSGTCTERPLRWQAVVASDTDVVYRPGRPGLVVLPFRTATDGFSDVPSVPSRTTVRLRPTPHHVGP